jgi:hypothetical protein
MARRAVVREVLVQAHNARCFGWSVQLQDIQCTSDCDVVERVLLPRMRLHPSKKGHEYARYLSVLTAAVQESLNGDLVQGSVGVGAVGKT